MAKGHYLPGRSWGVGLKNLKDRLNSDRHYSMHFVLYQYCKLLWKGLEKIFPMVKSIKKIKKDARSCSWDCYKGWFLRKTIISNLDISAGTRIWT